MKPEYWIGILFIIHLIIAMFFLMPDLALALDYRNSCDNTSYLRKTMEFTSCEGNNCTDYNFTQFVECRFGCDNVTHVCRQSEIEEYGMFGLYIIGGLILLGILVIILKKVF